MTVRRALWVALSAVVVVMIVVLIVGSRPNRSITARADSLARQLACPVCTGESVAESNAPESRAIRADIRRRLRAGESDARIRAAYVGAYGDKILLTPDSGGLGIVAWGVPVLAVVLGGAGIAVLLWRWSRTPRLSATEDDEAVVANAREHLA
jgi:cytochrome c-type biogenesis protein CcmH